MKWSLQLRGLIAGAVILAAFAAGWYFNGLRLTAKLETERRQVAEDARKRVEAAQEAAYEADERARKALAAIPRTGSKVDEAVRNHPTSPDCRVPDDVADRLQDGINAGKASTSG